MDGRLAFAIAVLAGVCLGVFVSLPPGPAVTPLYLAPVSAVAAIPIGVLFITCAGRSTANRSASLVLAMAVPAALLLGIRVWTTDYGYGPGTLADFGHAELTVQFAVTVALGTVAYMVAAAWIHEYVAREPQYRRNIARGAAIISSSVAGILVATLAYNITPPNLYPSGTDTSAFAVIVSGCSVAFAVVLALRTPIHWLAAPLTCWPAWMTAALLEERRGWSFDVSPSGMVTECARQALIATSAGLAAVFVVTLVRAAGERPSQPSSP